MVVSVSSCFKIKMAWINFAYERSKSTSPNYFFISFFLRLLFQKVYLVPYANWPYFNDFNLQFHRLLLPNFSTSPWHFFVLGISIRSHCYVSSLSTDDDSKKQKISLIKSTRNFTRIYLTTCSLYESVKWSSVIQLFLANVWTDSRTYLLLNVK